MKIIMFFLSLLAMLGFSAPGHAEDAAEKALDDARNYAASGDYAKALERHEWFHENALSIRPSYYGVRLSFALSAWKRLGDQYPPALASLKATRDADVRALNEGTGTREDFHDVSSINQELGEEDATVSLFKELHAQKPALAKKCFPVIQETLLAKGETDLFLQYAGELSSYMQTRVDRHRKLTQFIELQEHPGRESTLKHFDDKLVNTALQLIAIAEKQGDQATAQKIREIASDSVADRRLKTP
ncbi:MAG TPA: hypothetical protein VNQ90_21085 [Chthoniobacteraceae bacterium]|nr:hypothetical protein [Chthoniobacteraceae bacterium]